MTFLFVWPNDIEKREKIENLFLLPGLEGTEKNEYPFCSCGAKSLLPGDWEIVVIGL